MSSGLRFGAVVESRGWILAFDTSEDLGSVALVRVGGSEPEVDSFTEQIDERREQASRLVPTIRSVLASADLGVDDLAGVVVGAGPGSFTGVRVAASTAKGLVFGTRLPLWTPSSLEGAAMDPSWGEEPVRAVAFDARGDRVYAAAYEVGSGRAPAARMTPIATTIEDFAKRAAELGSALGGTAARRHRELAALAAFTIHPPPIGDPSAIGLIRALELDPERQATENPWDFEPLYLRGSSAQPSQPR